MKPFLAFLLLSGLSLVPCVVAADELPPRSIVVPVPSAERGRALFAAKGCVVCHSVNGVGGKAGPALDADGGSAEISPLDFAGRMWSGAQAMVVLQALEFGYQIQLTGEEIADIAAFVSDDDQRNAFDEDDVPEEFRGWTIDARVGALSEEVVRDPVDNLTRGYVLAERWCADCHVIRPGGEGGVAGPSFGEVAGKPDASEEAIVEWLSAPHEEMPEIMRLTDANLADLAAYILSLRP